MDSKRNKGGFEEGPLGEFDAALKRELGAQYGGYLEALSKEGGYVETRHPAPGFEEVVKTIPDEDFEFAVREILAQQDLKVPREASNFFHLAASLKAFDPQRFERFASPGLLSPSIKLQLEDRLKEYRNAGKYDELVFEAHKFQTLFPQDTEKVNSEIINPQSWNEILRRLEQLQKNGYEVEFAKLYSLAFALNPSKLGGLMPVSEDFKKDLLNIFNQGSMPLGIKAGFASDMDTITSGQEDRQKFGLEKKEWESYKAQLMQSINKHALVEIDSAKKTGSVKSGLEALLGPIDSAIRCKYAIVKE